MMKVISFKDIDGCRIVSSVGEGSVDPEATKAEIARQTGQPAAAVHLLPNYRELFHQHKICFPPGPGQQEMEDSEADSHAQALGALGPNQLLLITGEVIPNYAGTEYWQQTGGRWGKRKIERIGETPEGIPAAGLTPEQQEEIRAQEEETRICCMPPEMRVEALQRELDALADEAAGIEKRKQIQGIPFDARAWYQKREAAARQKYGQSMPAANGGSD
jgi:hypothetical protein